MKSLKQKVKQASRHFRERASTGSPTQDELSEDAMDANASGMRERGASEASGISQGDSFCEDDDRERHGGRTVEPESLQILTHLIHQFSGLCVFFFQGHSFTTATSHFSEHMNALLSKMANNDEPGLKMCVCSLTHSSRSQRVLPCHLAKRHRLCREDSRGVEAQLETCCIPQSAESCNACERCG